MDRKLELKRKLIKIENENQLSRYDPYPFQEKFHNDPSPRRGLQSANKIGKTYCGCPEDAIHLTGRYPDWWKGIRFDHPVKLVAACVNNDKTRDVLQRALFGNPVKWEEELGTGWVPKDCIGTIQKKRGVPDAFYHVLIKHHTNGQFDGWSQLTFLAYEMPTETWMAHEADINHLDEEPPTEKLEQASRSTIATGGIIYLTYTPENGRTDVVQNIESNWSCHKAGWVDVAGDDFEIEICKKKIVFKTIYTRKGRKGHLGKKNVLQSLNDYPDYQIPMRAFGEPVLGSGLVFMRDEEEIKCVHMEFQDYFEYLDAIDFGGLSSTAHPTAWGRMAYDPQNDVIYIYDGFRVVGQEIPDVATKIRMKPNTDIVKTIWPHDGNKITGQGMATQLQYLEAGVNMDDTWFTNPPMDGKKEGEGGNAILPGITEMSTRFKDGRLKVFSTVTDFFEEYRIYHMKDGKIVTREDDFMSVVRYLVQSVRLAKKLEQPKPYVPSVETRNWMSA